MELGGWEGANKLEPDLSFYDIFVPQKVPLSKISEDVVAYDL